MTDTKHVHDPMDPHYRNEWIDCYQCGGEGLDPFEGECSCMDDTCCCAEPDYSHCGVCNGHGGWWKTSVDKPHQQQEKPSADFMEPGQVSSMLARRAKGDWD